MIWSARKQYYLGLYFHHSVDIISTCYVYENSRKWFRSRTCKNIAGKFEILFFYFDDLHLQIIESISPKASKLENLSAQWAIFLNMACYSIFSLECTFCFQFNFYGKYRLCQQFQQGQPCKVPEHQCTFSHSEIEAELWTADQQEEFDITRFIEEQRRLSGHGKIVTLQYNILILLISFTCYKRLNFH